MPDNVIPLTREQTRSRRHREVSARTISIKRLPKRDLNLGRLLYPADEPLPIARPQTRGDCASVPRPCPFVGCAHNLYLDVSTRTGAIKMNFPDLEPKEMAAAGSCALDVAENGSHTLEQVGELLNFTRERERQIEVSAFAKLKLAGGAVLREVAEESFDHSRDREGALDRVMSEGGGGGRIPAAGGESRVGDEAALLRALVYRVLDRRMRERGLVRGRVPDEDALAAQTDEAVDAFGSVPLAEKEPKRVSGQWTADDDAEVEDWSSEVLRELRAGKKLREVLGLREGVRLSDEAIDEICSRHEGDVAPVEAAPPARSCAAAPSRVERLFLGAASGPAEVVEIAPEPPRNAIAEDEGAERVRRARKRRLGIVQSAPAPAIAVVPAAPTLRGRFAQIADGVIAALASGALTPWTIGERIGSRASDVGIALERLRDAGRVKNVGAGYWALVDEVQAKEVTMGEAIKITGRQAAVFEALKALVGKGDGKLTNLAIAARANLEGQNIASELAGLRAKNVVSWETSGVGRGATRVFTFPDANQQAAASASKTAANGHAKTNGAPRAQPQRRAPRAAATAVAPSSEGRLVSDMRAARAVVVAEYEARLAKIDAAIEAFS